MFDYQIENQLSKYADEITNKITEEGGIEVSLLNEIIALHELKKHRMIRKYRRYRTDEGAVPIHNRDMPESTKVNNKLVNDYFSEIVDTKVGYLFGNPVVSQVDKSMVRGGATAYDDIAIKMQSFRKNSSLDDMNGETCKMAAICGYDAALAYIDREGEERVMRVDPWEAIIISRTEYTEPDYAIRYYTTWDDHTIAELYDRTKVYTYDSPSTAGGSYVFKGAEYHMFDYCPLWGIPNNAELQGDADKVFSLIDAYDRTTSDFNSEIEQFRLAYMLFFGVEPDEETIEKLKQTGALHVPPTEAGESPNNIMYLTKQMNHAALDSHLDRLESNIMRFAKHVNFTDESFGGNLSGVAMRYKIFHLETKTKYFERKHDAATMYMYKVIASAWKKKGIDLDWTTIENKYSRNLPINVTDEAEAATALMGIVSRRTALSTLSMVNDVDREMEEIEREKGDIPDLDNVVLDDPNTDIEEKEEEEKGAGVE